MSQVNKQSVADYMGVDVSREFLDLSDGRRLPNHRTGHAALVRGLRKRSCRVVCEPSGPYHVAMARALQKAGVGVCVVNPAAVRAFAHAKNQRAKTDRIDAALLAEYGRHFNPKLAVPVSPQQLELAALVERRAELVEALVAERNRLGQQSLPSLRRHLVQAVRSLERLLAQIEAALDALLASCPELATKVKALSSVKGVGKLTALALLAWLPELGSLSCGQAAALCGVAPFTRQSGQWKGKSFISGGRAKVRAALYMPALVASRRNPVLQPLYDRLCASGKAPKVALVALMRKLVIYLNSILKNLPSIPA